MSDVELQRLFEGQDAVVYAVGLDDRQAFTPPASVALKEDHLDGCGRVLRTAKACGVRTAVVFASYFSAMHRAHPELNLTQHHVYIRSRVDQCAMVCALNDTAFSAFVFEVPYVVGSTPGRIPPWSFLFSMLLPKVGPATFFGRGGTAWVTANQVAAAALNVAEQKKPGGAFPVVGGNITWRDLAALVQELASSRKRVMWLSESALNVFGLLDNLVHRLKGKVRGLDAARLAPLQFSETFFSVEESMAALGHAPEDLRPALAAMFTQWQREQT